MATLLNPKHERFAQERARGKSLADAWELAGGTRRCDYPCRLGQRPDIVRRIRDILAERSKLEFAATKKAAKVLSVDKLWVLARLVDNVNRAMQARKVTVRGEATGEFRYDGSVANRALELLGKELGMFVERNENTTVQHVISDEPLTPEQWKERYLRKDN